MNSAVVQNVALATWGHADSIVRVKLKKEQPPWPVVRAPELDPVSTSFFLTSFLALMYGWLYDFFLPPDMCMCKCARLSSALDGSFVWTLSCISV